ncbi:hypothetical protein SFC65_24415 [Priestia filamentosa]|uniref:hypothetical protein n=1 Tax=Priestia filamentosa TaxID=1402861 RepID=UPI003982480A
MKKLTKLMEQGWTVHIECKGSDRNYPMSFEAFASQSVLEETGIAYPSLPIHATGNSLQEVIEKVEQQIIKR